MEGLIKANCDANLQVKPWLGISAIFRNHEGLVMASATWKLKGQDEATVAEALAILFTMRLVEDCGFMKMFFEGDNERVMWLVQNGQNEDKSYLGGIIKETQEIQSHFDICNFNSIPRTCKTTTHVLDQIAHYNPNKIWIEEASVQLNEVYFHDLIN